MSLEVVRGNITNLIAVQSLIACLEEMDIEGTLYVGYPVIASADDSHTIEAMLVSISYGLVAFHFPSINDPIAVYDEQDKIYYVIESNLSKHETLRDRRQLAVKPNVIAFFPEDSGLQSKDEYKAAYPEVFSDVLSSCIPINIGYYKSVCAAIQRVTTIKPIKKRANVKKHDSKGAILKILEKEVANLDQWQKRAAIEAPEGPQRVRGLAGSGKTIVLALKAAYLHAQHPDWNIVVTFNTRSLVQQFTDLIERFSIEHSGDKPDWDKLRIMHAWGTNYDKGVYSEVANAHGVDIYNFSTAKQKFGYNNAFSGACAELLYYIKSSLAVELYDAVLIDEAQDLPSPFFQIIYNCTKDPKRIIWAYDELQNLNNSAMPSLRQLFGENNDGVNNIEVSNTDGEARRDIILPVCYRNTPWTLTLAHALGMGIYREQGLVQLFDELSLFEEIGYRVRSGILDFEKRVSLERMSSSYPQYMTSLFKPDDVINCKSFNSKIEQYEWVANEIHTNIHQDELDLDDILVIFPNAISAKDEYMEFSTSMARHNIPVHLAGVSSSRDTFSYSGSVTASGIFRAKGNESPMVYIVNSDWCATGYEMIRLRNILFTAITRSSAWVRICGVGDLMGILESEINKVATNHHTLTFDIPTKDRLAELRIINRDRTDNERRKITSAKKNLSEIVSLIDEGLLNPEDPDIQAILSKFNK